MYNFAMNNEHPEGRRDSHEEPIRATSFGNKNEEYFDRIKQGTETIEKILDGIVVGGYIYNAIKTRLYEEVPHSCRDNKNKPFPYPILEEFLTRQTLSTNEEENLKNKRIRQAILYFSEQEWIKEEEAQIQEHETQEKIAALEQSLGVEPVVVPEAPDMRPEDIEHVSRETVLLQKNIQLPERVREYEQESIGDLNGSHESFVAHLTNRGLASFDTGEPVWSGQDKKVIFIGDILGDRTPEGLKIYSDLLILKKQAESNNGDVVWLSGNHENMFNAVLCGFSTEFGSPVGDDMQKRLSQYSGNLELADFLPDDQKSEIITEFINKKDSIATEIKETIKRKEKTLRIMESDTQTFNASDITAWHTTINDLNEKISFIEHADAPTVTISDILRVSDLLPKSIQNIIGTKILENTDSIKKAMLATTPELIEAIKKQQLIQVYDDTLYVHTNITKDMLDIIFKNMGDGETITASINKINMFYQTCLGAYIDDGGQSLTTDQVTSFNTIRDIFISTSKQSRVNFSEDATISDIKKDELEAKLKSAGVNLVVHGHTDEDGTPKGSAGLPIISIDRSAYKSDNPKNSSPTAAGAVSKNGKFSYF